jgi:O-antigen biosynthesis protein WbqP|tara:strand:+ start:151 stop:636 length:486 start_codon:yes stop_codon:yes gene_type:complete
MLIKFQSKDPIFFISDRIGEDKKVFKMIKFRTMKTNTPQINSNDLINPEKYITSFGKLLREYSLDEIPQILNVIKGDMSIVGPRPALFNQYELIKMRDKYNINLLKPGITGLAQINGRDNVSNIQKVKFDKEYLLRSSILLDIKIIFKTVKVLFKDNSIKH